MRPLVCWCIHRFMIRRWKLPRQTAEQVQVDDPMKEGMHLGPLSSRRIQFDKVQGSD